ncbi:MAG TPA: ABC transporter substrate-binding protein [Methylophilaceae bacterium]|jgi:phospholipid transport system substrate-binding protein
MKSIINLTIVLGLLTASALVDAEIVPPDQMVKNVANSVLDVIRNDKDIQNGDMRKITALTEEKILPHFDFERMSRVTLGKYWSQATPEQKTEFIKEFRSLITHTYSSALSKYRDQTIAYKPLLAANDDSDVKVKSLIMQAGGTAIPVDYLLEKGTDEWKVFDVNIDGISLVTTYRGQFASIIHQNGMDELIHQLEEKNKS